MAQIERLKEIFPATSAGLPQSFWHQFEARPEPEFGPEKFPDLIDALGSSSQTPAYLVDLARIEWALYQTRQALIPTGASISEISINPSLNLLQVNWHPLLPLLEGEDANPQPGNEMLAFWRQPGSGQIKQAVARPSDLLALKVVMEQLDPLAVAAETEEPVAVVDGAIEKAVARGLLLSPPSRIRRCRDEFPLAQDVPEKFVQAEVFTLQWHITQRCDLNCRHCYDRSHRFDVDYEKGIQILDQLRCFCLERHVGGQVSFSGGNPFMHPRFFDLYRAARDRNFNLAILGNPLSEAQLDSILQIAQPAFYQVSLEGLQPHNDLIRGKGNFESVLEFLDLLKRKNVFSMVMLTLTRGNMDQMLELAEQLRDRVDLFTYNRLSMVGEGANLESPPRGEYHHFVQRYLQAKNTNPVLALKDSLINIEREQQGLELFGGCTGFGCGAAFNFVSLLPDGEVHACRKFPSPIGHIQDQSLAEIYDGEPAKAYRRGCRSCASCRLRAVCGGCLAVAYGWGLDPFEETDPACFMPRG